MMQRTIDDIISQLNPGDSVVVNVVDKKLKPEVSVRHHNGSVSRWVFKEISDGINPTVRRGWVCVELRSSP